MKCAIIVAPGLWEVYIHARCRCLCDTCKTLEVKIIFWKFLFFNNIARSAYWLPTAWRLGINIQQGFFCQMLVHRGCSGAHLVSYPVIVGIKQLGLEADLSSLSSTSWHGASSITGTVLHYFLLHTRPR
jgi:hypothetical protein